MNMFGRLLPIEGYEVAIYESIPLNYTESLTHLYQPLIGVEAVSLYMTLLNEQSMQMAGHPQTHHLLMNYLQLPLDTIYEERQKLEGIGLLETYEQEIDSIKTYYYVLKSHFTQVEFFKDGMYSELLYHHLGYDNMIMYRSTLFLRRNQKKVKKSPLHLMTCLKCYNRTNLLIILLRKRDMLIQIFPQKPIRLILNG